CATQYRLEYIDRLGRIFHRPRAGFSFGTSLHRTLEVFHAAGGPAAVSPEELAETLSRSWIREGYASAQDEQEHRTEALRIVDAWHAAAVERAARTDLPPEPTLLYAEKTLRMPLFEGVDLSGRVDRVDEHHDGALEIVDYKSGRSEVSEEDVAGSRALGIYQLLLRNLHPDRRVYATLVALRTGASASHELGDDAAAELTEACADAGRTILAKDWDSVQPEPCDHCPNCDYLPYCQRHWRARGDAWD
ncbi:MAG: RecB family exonuclease, partial [Armatimonadota bacterium]